MPATVDLKVPNITRHVARVTAIDPAESLRAE